MSGPPAGAHAGSPAWCGGRGRAPHAVRGSVVSAYAISSSGAVVRVRQRVVRSAAAPASALVRTGWLTQPVCSPFVPFHGPGGSSSSLVLLSGGNTVTFENTNPDPEHINGYFRPYHERQQQRLPQCARQFFITIGNSPAHVVIAPDPRDTRRIAAMRRVEAEEDIMQRARQELSCPAPWDVFRFSARFAPDRFDVWMFDHAAYWPCPVCDASTPPHRQHRSARVQVSDLPPRDLRLREDSVDRLSRPRPAGSRRAVAAGSRQVDVSNAR